MVTVAQKKVMSTLEMVVLPHCEMFSRSNLPALSNDIGMTRLHREASKHLVYLADGSALPKIGCWGAGTYQVNTRVEVSRGGSFDALKAFYDPDDELIVESAMVELIAVKLAVSHAKFSAEKYNLHLHDPLYVLIDNTSMWNNRFGIGSAPPLKSGLRKMMDVVLDSVCDAFKKGLFGGEVWLIHKSMYGLSKAWYPDGLAKSAAAKQNEKHWWPVETSFEPDTRKLLMDEKGLLLQLVLCKEPATKRTGPSHGL